MLLDTFLLGGRWLLLDTLLLVRHPWQEQEEEAREDPTELQGCARFVLPSVASHDMFVASVGRNQETRHRDGV
jgi:hypothetical protein